MAYLNWKQEAVQVVVTPHARLQNQLQLTLKSEHIRLLAAELTEVFGQKAELRLGLPAGWTAFFKTTDGEGRLLMSHPEKAEWVGSFILDGTHAQKFLADLQHIATDGATTSIELSSMGGINFLSNLELVISLAPT